VGNLYRNHDFLWRSFYSVFLIAVFMSHVKAGESVVLLHGLARTDRSFSKMEAALVDAGYDVINFGYPSRSNDIESLAAEVIPSALSRAKAGNEVHFVTHSMGGILIRQYLGKKPIENLGRVVMLGPPNKGSQVVDKLQDVPGFELINGPAGMQLGTGEMSVPSQLGPANFEVGIVAGTRSINLILSTMLPSPDDGKVSVENTKLEGMSDHIELPVAHPFLMTNQRVIEQVIRFLKTGKFDKEE
jgi:pimeloyl-ACP methyl ester carboxylesterase